MADTAKWETQMVIFPEKDGGNYEHDYPYAVEYTADGGDGDRRTRKLTKAEIVEIRELNGLPPEVITSEDSDGGGE